ncbi:hypothetical protein BROUX41_004566 [Berkeleyomyces rouxiae]
MFPTNQFVAVFVPIRKRPHRSSFLINKMDSHSAVKHFPPAKRVKTAEEENGTDVTSANNSPPNADIVPESPLAVTTNAWVAKAALSVDHVTATGSPASCCDHAKNTSGVSSISAGEMGVENCNETVAKTKTDSTEALKLPIEAKKPVRAPKFETDKLASTTDAAEPVKLAELTNEDTGSDLSEPISPDAEEPFVPEVIRAVEIEDPFGPEPAATAGTSVVVGVSESQSKASTNAATVESATSVACSTDTTVAAATPAKTPADDSTKEAQPTAQAAAKPTIKSPETPVAVPKTPATSCMGSSNHGHCAARPSSPVDVTEGKAEDETEHGANDKNKRNASTTSLDLLFKFPNPALTTDRPRHSEPNDGPAGPPAEDAAEALNGENPCATDNCGNVQIDTQEDVQGVKPQPQDSVEEESKTYVQTPTRWPPAHLNQAHSRKITNQIVPRSSPQLLAHACTCCTDTDANTNANEAIPTPTTFIGPYNPTMDIPLYVKKLSDKAKLPVRGSTYAAGYDLSASKDTTIPARGKALVSTDLSIACPAGTYGRIAPRSGLAAKHFIDTGAGVIDADYRGEVKVLLFNHHDTDFEVKEGDRVAQLVLERIVTPEVVEVEALEESVRGAGGFGSTGGFGATAA